MTSNGTSARTGGHAVSHCFHRGGTRWPAAGALAKRRQVATLLKEIGTLPEIFKSLVCTRSVQGRVIASS